MKRQLRVLVLLLTIFISMLNFVGVEMLPVVKATYVEGEITQDTVWTLVDSPFVLSNNVIINPDVTLTIEPGVEVKFGGNFSLIVNGKLNAEGNINKTIKFTSNSLTPTAGDWGTILFNGTASSLLKYCIIEYGKSGITVEDGSIDVENCVIKLNSQDGVTINGGSVITRNDRVIGNLRSGIFVAGGSQITIQNCEINSNGDGIALSGDLTGEISISQNKISANENAGILYEAEIYNCSSILNNTLQANNYGFYISSNTSTYITRNYIFGNAIGILYEGVETHEAHFNDIYGNDLGMDVSSEASVNATYNYWGDKSGPHHEYLNPRGKGNPVGGDGVNLDFIFFLTAPINHTNTRPTAILWTDKELVVPNQPVTFVGTDSYDNDDGRVDMYYFDFGDGNVSGWTTLTLLNHSYSSDGTYLAKLKVMDDFGNESTIATKTINVVQNLQPLNVHIELDKNVIGCSENISITVHVTNGSMAVGNANVTLFAVKSGTFTPKTGLTNSTGYFTATFTAPYVTELTDIRIIARASKTGYTGDYADGSDYEYLEVLPALVVQASVDPETVKSEETATITVYVRDGFDDPIANVSLVLSCDNGVLSSTTGMTNSEGAAVFTFIAPLTTDLAGLNATLTITATKEEYTSEQIQVIIPIEPKVLVVEIDSTSIETISEAKINVRVHVTYDSMDINEANVTVTAEEIPTISKLTDPDGYVDFTLTAPPVNAATNLTVKARASKEGFADGESVINLTINPGILSVEFIASQSVVASGESVAVTVYVTCNGTPVANASVMVSSNYGLVLNPAGITDSNGYCTFTFEAPRTTQQISSTIMANVTKNGYISGIRQVII
ncbi:MAG: Ig-like domain-containing protein, partial [Candidatus Bathyarchaeia archaeon]